MESIVFPFFLFTGQCQSIFGQLKTSIFVLLLGVFFTSSLNTNRFTHFYTHSHTYVYGCTHMKWNFLHGKKFGTQVNKNQQFTLVKLNIQMAKKLWAFFKVFAGRRTFDGVSTTVCIENVTIVKCSLRDYDTIDSYELLWVVSVFLVVMVAAVVMVVVLLLLLLLYFISLFTLFEY